MNQFSHEMRRRVERRNQRPPQAAEAARRNLARNILAQIKDELAKDPDAVKLDASPTVPIGPLETYLLRHQRKEIMAKMALNRSVSAELDETPTPPVLHITLGEQLGNE